MQYIRSMVDRDRALTVRMSDEEIAKLHALAERDGVSQSDFVRLFIRRAYAEAFGDKRPPKPKK